MVFSTKKKNAAQAAANSGENKATHDEVIAALNAFKISEFRPYIDEHMNKVNGFPVTYRHAQQSIKSIKRDRTAEKERLTLGELLKAQDNIRNYTPTYFEPNKTEKNAEKRNIQSNSPDLGSPTGINASFSPIKPDQVAQTFYAQKKNGQQKNEQQLKNGGSVQKRRFPAYGGHVGLA